MRKETLLDFFGIKVKVRQFSAVEGLSIIFPKETVSPLVALSESYIIINEKEIRLNDRLVINDYIFDAAGVLPPSAVLKALLKLVDNFNFGFLTEWKSVKVPARFVSGARTVSSSATPSIIAQLIQDGVATKKELEEYYSLEDAFQMLDVMTAKGVNAALAAEAAEKERNK